MFFANPTEPDRELPQICRSFRSAHTPRIALASLIQQRRLLQTTIE